MVVGLAHLPWASLARRAFRVDHIRVEGTHYLDADRVGAIAGLHTGQSLLEIDGDRVRQALMLNPRIRNASVSREWPRGVCIRVVEREPLLLVRHGVPWEIDSSGVLLARSPTAWSPTCRCSRASASTGCRPAPSSTFPR